MRHFSSVYLVKTEET